jgi:hypothetical protein
MPPQASSTCLVTSVFLGDQPPRQGPSLPYLPSNISQRCPLQRAPMMHPSQFEASMSRCLVCAHKGLGHQALGLCSPPSPVLSGTSKCPMSPQMAPWQCLLFCTPLPEQQSGHCELCSPCGHPAPQLHGGDMSGRGFSSGPPSQGSHSQQPIWRS